MNEWMNDLSKKYLSGHVQATILSWNRSQKAVCGFHSSATKSTETVNKTRKRNSAYKVQPKYAISFHLMHSLCASP